VLRKPLISIEEVYCSTPSKISHFLTNKKRKAKFCFKKKQGERKICEEKELNKHLSFANRRRIIEDKKRQFKMIK
jgi:hypothetical protein